MEEVDQRVVDIDQAHSEAYVEDFQKSMQSGKQPAGLQRMDAAENEFGQLRDEYSQAMRNMSGNESEQSPEQVEQTAEAEEVLKDEPGDSGKSNKKPSFLSRMSKRVKAPFKKAAALYSKSRETVNQFQIDNMQRDIEMREAQIARQRERIQAMHDAEIEREARKEMFKENIKEKAQNLKQKVGRGIGATADFVKGIQVKGRNIAQRTRDFGSNVKDGVHEAGNVVRDSFERGREGYENSREAADARKAMTMMQLRMEENYLERNSFNRAMERDHGVQVGTDPLEVSSSNGVDVSERLAHEETKEFVRDENGTMVVDRDSPAYTQYMLELTTEQLYSESNGNMEDADFRDASKEMYEFMLEEYGETYSLREIHDKIDGSFSEPFQSKRMALLHKENPALTGVEGSLTDPSIGKNEDVYNTVGYDAAEDYSEETDPFAQLEHQQKQNNKEFNDVDIPNHGYIDLNQEDEKVVHLDTYRSMNDNTQSAVAPASPDRALSKQVLEINERHTKGAIQESKQLSLDLGMKDGPSGPNI